jgi:hypothetical protein
MEFWFLIAGSVLSFVGMLFHGILGQQKYMGNINNSELQSLTKSLSLVSWHIFTIFLFVSSVTLIYVVFYPALYIVAYPVIGINLLGSILFVFLGLNGHKHLLSMPGAYLMGFTALLAYLGL